MLSGLSTSYISLIFSRKRDPSLDAAERLALALEMTLDKFLEGLRGHKRNSSAWRVLDAKRRYKVAMRKRGYQAYVDAPV
jgi:transcriptional regulator with XRE-family HTH domain